METEPKKELKTQTATTKPGAKDFSVFQPGVKVWAKLRGYPWWPAQILRPDQIPLTLRKQGTEGKTPADHQAVLFFGERSYSYVHMQSLELYNEASIKKHSTKRTQFAMEEAETPGLFDHFTVSEEEPEVIEEYIVSDSEQVAGESSTAGKAKGGKKKRASTAADEEGDKKKRKRASTSGKGSGKQQQSAQPQRMYEGKPANERLLHFRHRLQRIFLPSTATVDEGALPVMRIDEFPIVDRLLTEVETFPDLTVDLLKETKIGKVIKRITQLRFPLQVLPHVHPAADGSQPTEPPAPVTVDEPANVVKRSLALLEQWRKMLSSSPTIVAAAVTAATTGSAEMPTVVEEKENQSSLDTSMTGSAESLQTVNQTEQAEAHVNQVETKSPPTTTAETTSTASSAQAV